MDTPALNIKINSIRISGVDTGSAFGIGNNYFIDWKTSSKTNAGFGRLNGDHDTLPYNVFHVDDPDFQDMVEISKGDMQEPQNDRGEDQNG